MTNFFQGVPVGDPGGVPPGRGGPDGFGVPDGDGDGGAVGGGVPPAQGAEPLHVRPGEGLRGGGGGVLAALQQHSLRRDHLQGESLGGDIVYSNSIKLAIIFEEL